MIVRGELDNRTRGRVTGKVWLFGRKDPVRLDLIGNCHRDLAGCVMKFENPAPQPADDERVDLASEQNGVTGDVTASRKVRVFEVPLEEALEICKEGGQPPEHIANSLYLEWFSEFNGRVVIESADYKINISPRHWTLSAEDEKAQAAAIQQAMRDWLERLDQTLHAERADDFDPEDEKPLDEFGYEKFMRESDARTDKYMQLLEKYEGHPDQEKIVAREMGWTWLEEALEADERGALPPREPTPAPLSVPNPLTEGVDWMRDDDGHIHHPLTKRAFESGMEMWQYCKDHGLLGDNADNDLAEMVFRFQTAGAKIAGALDGLAYDEDLRDGGFIVAALKRALNYLHQSLSAAETVSSKGLLPAERLQSFRVELFKVREEILHLCTRFRGRLN